MLTTHMDPQLTGSDVVTTEDWHLLTLNQVMELGKIEHEFKPTIVKKEFNWELPADPDPVGFHYMMMDELPREEPTHLETLTFEKKINPNCTPGAITRQPFSEDGKFVPVAGWWPDKGDVLEWQKRTRVYRATKELERKGGRPQARESH